MKNSIIISVFFVSALCFSQKKWTLQECINHAIENNISIKQSENTLLSNDQDIIAARGQFLPSVSSSLGPGMNIGSGFDPQTNQRVNTTTYSFNYNANVNQNIFNGFRIINQYKQSQLTKEVGELELDKLKNDIMLNVANSYLNVLFNKEQLETAKAQYDFSLKQIQQVKDLVDAGVQPKVNIYDAEATLSRDNQQVTLAENTLALSLLSLSQLLQVPFENFDVEIIEINIPLEELVYKDVKPVLKHALENRVEVKIAEKRIENAELSTEISKAGFYPSVSFGYRFSSLWSESENDFNKVPFFRELDLLKGHNFNLSVSIPIFSRLQNVTAVSKARIQEETSKLNLKQAQLDLESNIQRAYTDAQGSLKAYSAAKKSLELQELSFNNARERFDIGAMTSFDLEQARVQLINAQSSLITAKYDFVFKTKVLDFYMGKRITLD